MQAFSAADLISPAIKRTKWFLFEPFRLSTFLKLCLVAVLTEGGTSGRFNIPGGSHSTTSSTTPSTTTSTITASHFGLSPFEIALIAAIVVIGFGLLLVIGYLLTRLRFSLFHCLVSGTREIRPGWRLYEAQSWRFFLLNIAVGFAFLCAAALVAAAFFLSFVRMTRGLHAGSGALIGLILPLIPVIILFVLVGFAIQIILNDLMLPHMALENTSAGEAWRQVQMRITREKGGFLLYTFLRMILPMAAILGAIMVLAIPAIIAVVVFAVPMAGLTSLMAGATGAGKLLFILLVTLIVLVAATVVILLGLCISGPIGIAVRNYALLFYGGRYQVLGDLLYPPQSPPLIESPSGVV